MKKCILILLLLVSVSFSQNLQNTHFFNESFYDASAASSYVDAALAASFTPSDAYEYFYLSGNYSFSNITIGSDLLTFEDNSPSIISLGGRYNFTVDNFHIAAGAMLEINDPFNNYNYDYDGYSDESIITFTALRYYLNYYFALCGSFGFQFYNSFKRRENHLNLGALVSITSELTIMAEIRESKSGVLQLGAGSEYAVYQKLNIRGAFFTDGDQHFKIFAGISYEL